MKEADKCLDSQLWHACAGGMVQMPVINSIVYYFPQGHAEHGQANVDFGSCPRIPALILCRVNDIKFMADPETDEVFAKLRLIPLRSNEADTVDDGCNGVLGNNGPPDFPGKVASFAKTLTQSDANNGGGFSVPRYCAETIFPRLDYSADPPVQTVLAKDVHGEVWKFRHIYRGTPRRHLLTTGWSTFVNQKKLVAGDSIVFLRTENGDLCVGIRRAKRGIGFGLESPSGWNPPAGNCMTPYGGFCIFLREEDNKLGRPGSNGGSANSSSGQRGRGRIKPESVVDAASLAANGQTFEVVYYPRASTPEFCVKASAVRTALRIQWCSGMRFKMAFETEDSSRISWFMGTISGVQVADPIRWPNSPWRLLQVTWDEPDLLQNVKRVSPWLVELVSNMPAIHLSPFSPQRKKLRLSQNPDFTFDGQLPPPMFSGTPLGSSSNPLCFLSDNTPSGIQGARHAEFGISLSDLHIKKLQSGLVQTGFHHLAHTAPMSQISTGLIIGNPSIRESVSCLLSVGNPSQNIRSPCDAKTHNFVLFGKRILTEKQMALDASISPGTTRTDSDASAEQVVKIKADGIGSTLSWPGSVDSSSKKSLCCKEILREAGLDTGHCKVFMESDNVGRTLDLSVLSSYEELYKKLVDMFGIAHSDMKGHVLYRDSVGTLKHAGDEPFGDFARTTRRLMILMDLESDKGSSETVKLPCKYE